MGWLIPLFIAIVFDVIVGVFTHKALSTTSLSPVATELLTFTIVGVFLIVEIIGIVLLGGSRTDR